MARFEPNPNLEREMQPELQRELTRTVQQVLDEVGRKHGKSEEGEVRRALTAAAERRGIHNWTPPDDGW